MLDVVPFIQKLNNNGKSSVTLNSNLLLESVIVGITTGKSKYGVDIHQVPLKSTLTSYSPEETEGVKLRVSSKSPLPFVFLVPGIKAFGIIEFVPFCNKAKLTSAFLILFPLAGSYI